MRSGVDASRRRRLLQHKSHLISTTRIKTHGPRQRLGENAPPARNPPDPRPALGLLVCSAVLGPNGSRS